MGDILDTEVVWRSRNPALPSRAYVPPLLWLPYQPLCGTSRKRARQKIPARGAVLPLRHPATYGPVRAGSAGLPLRLAQSRTVAGVRGKRCATFFAVPGAYHRCVRALDPGADEADRRG